ncbi:hypothetical protein L208DRAFT_1325846 [Tricholoma matsutake]|nr:hypothetical protein L208DRAFT_1325846 [Tricholoma matsutake 945]
MNEHLQELTDTNYSFTDWYIPKRTRTLCIWQQNVRKSPITQQYVLNSARPEDWDIIALQEPFLDSIGNTKASPYWRVLYPTDHHKDGSDHSYSILLINTNISTDAYTPLDIPCNDITVVHFSGEFSHLSILNIYNDCTHNNNLSALWDFLTSSTALIHPTPQDQMIWLGDFNRHHPLWESEDNHHLNSSKQH